MTRHGYSDDLEQWDLIRWRGAVASAIRGKRGQKMLRDLRDALDAMPEKRLIEEDLKTEEGVCALGCVAEFRGVEAVDQIDPYEFELLSRELDVAECLIRETEFVNDEAPVGRSSDPEAARWRYMRDWVDRHLKEES